MDLEMSLTALSTVGRGVLERQLKFQSSSISPLLLLLFFHALTKEASNGVGSNCTDFIIHSNTIKNAGSSGSPLTFLHPKPVIRSTLQLPTGPIYLLLHAPKVAPPAGVGRFNS